MPAIRTATIQNEQGIHCRPSALIVKEFMNYPGQIAVTHDDTTCSVGSVMQILALELHRGSTVTIEVDGPDEEQTADRLAELFATCFDFPPE